ncbi:hypothetical protein HYG81_07995 [Natrinema zhouii]|uniref:Uncharacterized protein n=1 Tax=Natrinema zhouii TaxID=1710539 RepID=A0A7D6CTL0_9EURY|nr:hypothetical protein [Natrinema zhouii]QLK27531.1 hypothetical protein HYG81_07995 [Natrinema zhouii]
MTDTSDTDTILELDDLVLEGDYVQELAENQYVIRADTDKQNTDLFATSDTGGPLAESPVVTPETAGHLPTRPNHTASTSR